MLRHHENMWCLTSKVHKLENKTSPNFDNNYISAAKLTKLQLLRYSNTASTLFHMATTEECVKIPLVISLLNKPKDTNRRKADANDGLWDGSGGRGQGTQEGTWDSD